MSGSYVPVPVAGPWVTDLEVEFVAEAARTAWYDRANDFNERFELAFAAYADRSFAISLPSCTAGLHLSLLAAGVGPGDSVIVPDATWIASAAPVSYVGARTVFSDVDPDTWCLTPEAVEPLIDPTTRAVIAVDLYGAMPRLDELEVLCRERGVMLIEDAAEAVGGRLHGRPAGNFGNASAFSFHGSKTLTTGEGGMVLTDDEVLHARMQFLRDHGRRPGDTTFRNAEIAYKYKMSSLQAAFGLAQLQRVDQLVARKREIFGMYHARLGDLEGVTLNAEPSGTTNAYWMSTAIIDGRDKFELGRQLESRGIRSRPFFSPLSSLDAYADAPDAPRAQKANRTAYAIAGHGINLPSALSLTEDDVDFVCRELIALL